MDMLRWIPILALALGACESSTAPSPAPTGPDVARVMVNTPAGLGRAAQVAAALASPTHHACRLEVEEPVSGAHAYGFLCPLRGGATVGDFAWLYVSGALPPVQPLLPRLTEDGWSDCELVRQVGEPETLSVFECRR